MKQRERYIDIAKGFAILCIVLLHYENGIFTTVVNTFIGSFMITMFYLTTGWLFAMNPTQPTLKGLAKKRWKQLGVPYLWWTGIILAFDLILFAFDYYDGYFIQREAYKAIVLRGIGTLWFLPALFGGEIIWYWLFKKKNRLLIIVAFLFTIAIRQIYYTFFEGHNETFWRIVDAPFRTIDNILGAWVIIAAGYYSYKLFAKYIASCSSKMLCLLGLFLCILAFFAANHFPVQFLWGYVAPVLGPLGFLLLFKSMQNFRLFDYFDYWGCNSLILMVTHYSIVEVLFTLIAEKGLGYTFSGWVAIVCCIISMPLQYIIAKKINAHAKFLIGK